ncbi:hypothetical protein SPI_06988 [Niveomyces insectorum RCEF 264]|uniref:F-box domain-containing protein n=1 Tax=Niveomyces insectorum RCEF 264 TaxID=1081102 RepID=A0A167QYN5_9HYPO|nr:hypothetical protein SPI_06988 [Niveomyces insectorum RCEF 264]
MASIYRPHQVRALLSVTALSPQEVDDVEVFVPAQADSEPVRASLCLPFPTVRQADLGTLHRLPTDILWLVCLMLDARSCFALRQVNRTAREVVTGLPQYRLLMRWALESMQAIFRSRVARYVTLGDLHRVLHNHECAICNVTAASMVVNDDGDDDDDGGGGGGGCGCCPYCFGLSVKPVTSQANVLVVDHSFSGMTVQGANTLADAIENIASDNTTAAGPTTEPTTGTTKAASDDGSNGATTTPASTTAGTTNETAAAATTATATTAAATAPPPCRGAHKRGRGRTKAAGMYLFLPTLTRCCASCLEESPGLRATPLVSLCAAAGMETQPFAPFACLPPGAVAYAQAAGNANNTASARSLDMLSMAVIAQDKVTQVLMANGFSRQRMKTILCESGCLDEYSSEFEKPWRQMVTIFLPVFDRSLGRAIEGLACRGCYNQTEKVFGFLEAMPKYRQTVYGSEDAFLAHFERCPEAIKLWKRARKGLRLSRPLAVR